MKSARTKACAISDKVKQEVGERDSYTCVICKRPGIPNAHYLGRGCIGGLGIKENVVCLCPECHHNYDNGDKHKEYGAAIKAYLEVHYPGFPDEQRIFKNKWVR